MMLGRFDLPGYYVGDCRALLAELPDESVNCVVTSPPYWGLRDYGVAGQLGLEETPEAYVAAMVDVFEGVQRALRPDGTLWLNLGDSYAGGGHGGPTGTMALEGSGRNMEACREVSRRPRLLKTCGLKPKDLVGIPWRVAFALQAAGWWLRSDIIWAKPNPMPESVTDRPTKAHEYLFLLAKSESYHYDAAAIREASVTLDPRRPYTSEGAKSLDGREHWHSGQRREGDDFSERNRRSVWTIATEPTPDAHFATFPRKLVEPCILAGCPAGGVVLDPFGGSGTVGRVAEDLGRKWLLFDLNPEYARIAARKTAQRSLLGPDSGGSETIGNVARVAPGALPKRI